MEKQDDRVKTESAAKTDAETRSSGSSGNEKRFQVPPDGGYGWVIVASSFVGHGFNLYNIRAVGVLLLDLKNEFNVSYANLNIIFSLLVGCMFITAPIVSLMANRFGSRTAVIIGGLLQFLGISLSSLAPSIVFIHTFFGFVAGLGMSFTSIPLSVEIGRYFTARRSLALGVQQIGPSVFSMIAPPCTQYLIDSFGWRGAVLITGALNLNVVVCGALLRPLHLDSDSDEKNKKGNKKIIDASMFQSKKFNIYIFTLALLTPALFLMSYYVIAFARSEQGYTEYQAALLLTISSVFGLGARPITGLAATYTNWTCFSMMTILSALMAICYVIYPFVTSYWASASILAVFAFGVGGVSPLTISGLTEIVGPSRLMSAFGIQGLTGAVTAVLTQPFAGWLSDVFGTLAVTFWIGFVMMSISAFLLFLYCAMFHAFMKSREDTRHEEER